MLDGRFRFDNFVVGTANRLAVSAARAIAESPGSIYNPLFIYGASGLGKTHLLGALGYAARALHPTVVIEYVTLDDFIDQLHEAIAHGQSDTFKGRYKQAGILLIDDVQFLSGHSETQNEMLRIVNAMQQGGRQLVMTSDRPPHEIADVDQRLLTRCAAGLTVDIGAPDYETRVAILRHKCAERGLSFAAGVLEEMARAPISNVRELQGALNRHAAHQALAYAPRGSTPPGALLVKDLTPPRGNAVAPASEYESFLSDLATTVAAQLEPWRVRLNDLAAHWEAQGYAVDRIRRAQEGMVEVDVDALESAFVADIERLRALERIAARLSTDVATEPVFRNPDRVASAERRLIEAVRTLAPVPASDPSLKLEDFRTDAGADLARQAAAEVIQSPGTRYEPLVLVGKEEAGTTHLAHAIGNALAAQPGKQIACLSGARFVEEVIAALQDGSVELWRARYRAADGLVITGIDAIAKAERSQDEFFHLFNALSEGQKQIVLTAALSPDAIDALESRVRTRLAGGLVVELSPAPSAEPSAIGYFHDTEKVVREWPTGDGRLLEEFR